MATKDEKKVFDVSKPSEVTPSATSKPVIIGHKPLVSDPTIKSDKEITGEDDEATPVDPMNETAPDTTLPTVADIAKDAASKPKVISVKSSARLKPSDDLVAAVAKDKQTGANSATNNEIASALPENEVRKPAVPESEFPENRPRPDPPPTKAPERKKITPQPPESASEKTEEQPAEVAPVTSVLGDAQSTRQAEIAQQQRDEAVQKLMEEGNYRLPLGAKPHHHGQRRGNVIGLLLVLLAIIGVLGYLAIDSGFVKSNVKLPFDLIKNIEPADETFEPLPPTKKATPSPTEPKTEEKTTTGNAADFASPTGKFSLDNKYRWQYAETVSTLEEGQSGKVVFFAGPTAKLTLHYRKIVPEAQCDPGAGDKPHQAGNSCPTLEYLKVQKLSLTADSQKVLPKPADSLFLVRQRYTSEKGVSTYSVGIKSSLEANNRLVAPEINKPSMVSPGSLPAFATKNWQYEVELSGFDLSGPEVFNDAALKKIEEVLATIQFQ